MNYLEQISLVALVLVQVCFYADWKRAHKRDADYIRQRDREMKFDERVSDK